MNDLLGIVVVHSLPAIVGTAPVVGVLSWSNPGAVAAVKVPGVVVAQQQPEALAFKNINGN